MKTWWLAAVLLVGCASNDKPDIDATGTVTGQMTWGGGNCQKSGSEPFTIFIAKIDSFNYNITTNTVGASIGGSVVCGPEYCQIMYFKQWSGANQESLSLDGTLTLDGDTNAITGNGKYDSFDAVGSCEQQVTYTATLQ
ncbi:MAG TPA: hypothetical protein VFV99_09640 [Kofleriaceae bacterium]|nr:hypothetical protein [Kofleriaceae bacterium]